jgi:hypothetical protein
VNIRQEMASLHGTLPPPEIGKYPVYQNPPSQNKSHLHRATKPTALQKQKNTRGRWKRKTGRTGCPQVLSSISTFADGRNTHAARALNASFIWSARVKSAGCRDVVPSSFREERFFGRNRKWCRSVCVRRTYLGPVFNGLGRSGASRCVGRVLFLFRSR